MFHPRPPPPKRTFSPFRDGYLGAASARERVSPRSPGLVRNFTRCHVGSIVDETPVLGVLLLREPLLPRPVGVWHRRAGASVCNRRGQVT